MTRKAMPNIKKLQGKRILVVDDQPFISEILTDLLSRYDHPSQANNGQGRIGANQTESARRNSPGS